MMVTRNLPDIIGYLVDKLATPAQNQQARRFWQQIKALAERQDATQITRYRQTSQRLIRHLATLPQPERDSVEQMLYRELIQPYGPTLDPKEFEQIKGTLRRVLHKALLRSSGTSGRSS